MQAASKISSDGALNLLELEENFGRWKGMRSMERYEVYGCPVAVHKHLEYYNSLVSTLILRTASSL